MPAVSVVTVVEAAPLASRVREGRLFPSTEKVSVPVGVPPREETAAASVMGCPKMGAAGVTGASVSVVGKTTTPTPESAICNAWGAACVRFE